MTGKILGFVKSNGMGTIAGSDKKRYKFTKEEWRENNSIKKGMEVDFEIDENGLAKDIFLSDDAEAKGSWFSSMSKFEKYFWGTIIVLAVLYIAAEMIAYVNTKNVQQRKANEIQTMDKANPGSNPQYEPQDAKRAISNNLSLELEKLYRYIDDTISVKTIEKSALNEKLELIHSKYIVLLKEHMALMDNNAISSTDTDKHPQAMDKIYSNLKNSQILQSSKEEIDISSTNGNKMDLDDLIHELKNKYRVLFENTSKGLQAIYFETNSEEQSNENK